MRKTMLPAFLFCVYFVLRPLFGIDFVHLDDSPFGLEDSFEYFEDSSGNLRFSQIRTLAEEGKFSSGNISSLGYTNSVIWIRLNVKNSSNRSIRWILEYQFPDVDLVEYYDFKMGESPFYRAGDGIPFAFRPVQYRNPVFPSVALPKTNKFVFLRIKSDSRIQLSFRYYSSDTFYKKVIFEQFLFGLFFGSMLILAFYYLLLYFYTKEKSYFYFASYISGFSFFQFVLEGFGFQVLWPDAIFWTNSSVPFFFLISLFLMCSFVNAYLDLENRSKTSFRLFRYSQVLLLLFALGSPFVPERFGIWIGLFVAFGYMIFLFIGGIRSFTQGGVFYFLFAWGILFSGTILFLFLQSGWFENFSLRFWVIEISSLFHVVLMGLGLADRVKILSRTLSVKIRELRFAKRVAERSEKRFKNLFEESEEFLFTMDTNGKIRNANKALGRLLGFDPEEVIGWDFLDLIFVSGVKNASYAKILVRDKIEELLTTEKSSEFTAEFRQKFVLEPRQIRVRLQLLDLGNEKCILGKAYELNEDVFAKFIVSESMHFTLNNYLRNADLLSRLLTVNLARFIGTEVVIAIRTCIREIIINSIEHGNLAISFDEKTEALDEGRYLELIQGRQKEPFYGRRTVKVSYSLNARRIGFLISDEGEGFDYKKILNLDIKKLNETSLTHGRGILMTRSVFDIVRFNEKGNRVLLIKYLKKPLRYKREQTAFDV
ncbi:7TM diverse intracellular signaling domain-containing protein [Leptospira borgpetersenii]|uniref:7TM diverse intracellular signaling domain-containing protein n=1 Tax=Leptospira borgpetersenii TaxID=174 RepID=UPI000773E6CA|nr:7TM diverse intracellular signaling domain-containing protein [Leptospira borgpetersenii]MBE8398762.1 ATP-binding protein [Leptospira borgpetersenii serovar Tarassovi]MBE8401773.1 ATP-binding protein [Leptospira borgpetersenii serovar Tarassovi]MBE8405198.1 ATP-binding protein [Leptospira borgpetersenii serovar Tarassovi]MBE8412762.1 ATP-binding protein [Leptospira borgpetersenii serovar Tarassovi]MBE8414265.1 ATP-binding protein [Leptospira borgpetersenii serovar Tarassovi]